MEDYGRRQVVGMDLHRRRSVLVRMTEDGRRLSTSRITNSPQEPRREIARAGRSPKVVLEANGWYWAADTLAAAGAEVRQCGVSGDLEAWCAVSQNPGLRSRLEGARFGYVMALPRSQQVTTAAGTRRAEALAVARGACGTPLIRLSVWSASNMAHASSHGFGDAGVTIALHRRSPAAGLPGPQPARIAIREGVVTYTSAWAQVASRA